MKSINGRLRDEFLNLYQVATMRDAREKLKAWQHQHNHHRPYGSPGVDGRPEKKSFAFSCVLLARERSSLNDVKRHHGRLQSRAVEWLHVATPGGPTAGQPSP
ncbi:integrase core domain-containing protein [Hydrogenophaga sp.]|uniref:integrase core domain-containing protein n=1 Tax=Hydrogenophaga sp. TaxID=1904254 RepID=UPI00344C8BC9